MRIFAAALSTETNTFAPWPTGQGGFVEIPQTDHAASDNPDAIILRELYQKASRDGHEIVVGLVAFAEPSGPTLQSVYEGFRERIVADFIAKGPFDIALLFLHGAMVSTECDDCEGDLIAHLREAGGAALTIGVELDPHCHLTVAMVKESDAIVLMKEYPHTDFVARAEELYDICTRKRARLINPVPAVFDCRMIGFYPTTTEPMLGLLRQIREEERRPGIVSISFVHGFPWGDSPEAGSKVLVLADNDPPLAAAAAVRIGRAIYAEREALQPRMPDLETALDLAAEAPGRIVLADTADNAGGGAPSDNVSLLRAILARSLRDAAFGCVWDPVAVNVCADAGVGSRFALRLGGKCGPSSGDPLDIEIVVRAISKHHDQQGLGDSRVSMGASVWIESGGVDIVVNSIRTQTFSPDAFTGLGIDLSRKRLIGVKSSQHFRANFASIADHVILAATPGALQMDFAALAYRKKTDLEYFPRTRDPLGGARAGSETGVHS
jgi:microcystin degradation protein MlrC